LARKDLFSLKGRVALVIAESRARDDVVGAAIAVADATGGA